MSKLDDIRDEINAINRPYAGDTDNLINLIKEYGAEEFSRGYTACEWDEDGDKLDDRP